jgi:hypothetical protein
MNITSISRFDLSFFKEKIFPPLTSQQKKIVLIASAVFGCLAVFWIVCRYKFQAQITDGPGKKSFLCGLLVEEGEFTDNELRGVGKCTYLFGLMIEEGKFHAGELNGYGKCSIKIPLVGTIVQEGQFKHGDLNGLGKITFSNKRVEEGIFKNGKLIRPNK